MSNLDLDGLTRKFMDELVSSLKDATYTLEMYLNPFPKERDPPGVSQ